MKKFIYIFSILSVAFLSSCDNKAIPESIIDPPAQKYNVAFQLNPETVVEPFEHTRSYLEKLNSGASLCLKMLVYNEERELIASKEEKVNTYLSKSNMSLELEAGNYLVIAISYVKWNDGYQYWTISGEQTLSMLTLIKDNTYLPDEFNLIGIDSKQIEVNKNGEIHKMDLKPSCAVLWIAYDNINAWDGLSHILLLGDKKDNSMQFDNSAKPIYNYDLEDDLLLLHRIEIEKITGDEYNHLICVLPMNEFNLLFGFIVDEEGYNTDKFRLSNVEAGKEYYASIKLDDNFYYTRTCGLLKDAWWWNTNNSPLIENSNGMNKLLKRNVKSFNLRQQTRFKVVDLIK